ncbi:uncharacterized protein LOC116139130 [Pistacia vera]|uniref:uncharacterized protein LOC116117463 n=1 Tax=Pistacia vera TaxID=55513 RepID=UPI001262BEA8|nr:uncharacterized protein LOC116117463 [Pistacia vera]XP_031280660.1 uncharacterized protein LOC116139130 [Pistacia vera]
MVMELTELSLAPTLCVVDKSSGANGSLSQSENNPSRKRKLFSDQILFKSGPAAAAIQPSVDLQLKDRLPLDWEQCLDLESGRMYYLNRKTLRKIWDWPENNNQKLDLELNMSTVDSNCAGGSSKSNDSSKNNSSSSSNMVALACLNCHLLVILSKASPSCPNCKYVHSLPTLQTQTAKPPAANNKSLNTLSLLN